MNTSCLVWIHPILFWRSPIDVKPLKPKYGKTADQKWWALRDLNPQPKDSSLCVFRRFLDYVTTHGLARCG